MDEYRNSKKLLLEWSLMNHISKKRNLIQNPLKKGESVHWTNVGTMADKHHIPLGYEIGLLHDTVEDGYCTYDELKQILKNCSYDRNEIGIIIYGVEFMTDKFTHEKYPDKNRDWRKHAEAVQQSLYLKADCFRVKCFDIIDNIKRMEENDFKLIWLKEKVRWCDIMFNIVNKSSSSEPSRTIRVTKYLLFREIRKYES